MLRTALAGLMGLGLALSAVGLPASHAEWYLLESRGLVALTDGNPDQAEALLTDLLAFRTGLAASLPEGPDADGRPLQVYLFRDRRSFEAYKPVVNGRVSGAAGFFLPRREGAFVAMELSSPSSLRIVRHELVHHELHRRFGPTPPWLDEGLAEYLSVARLGKGELILGDPIGEHRERLAGTGGLPAEKLVRVARFESAHSGGEQARRLYAESWSLVHWLRTGGVEPRALFDRLLDELELRGPEARDLVELGGFEPGALDRNVATHFRLDPLPQERVRVPMSDLPALTRRRVNRAVALAWLGELLHAEGRHADAAEHHDAARSRRDTLARAWRGLGLVHEAEGRAKEARPFLERAAELAPEDPEILLSLGRNLLGVTARDFDADRVPRADAERGRQVLRAAVSLASDRAESLAALGLAGLMVEKGADAETGAALEVAREVLPHRTDIAYHLMLWHLRRRELEKALALLDGCVLQREPEGSELAIRASNIATGACIQRARELRREGENEEAARLLESRLAAGVHEALRPQVLKELQASR